MTKSLIIGHLSFIALLFLTACGNSHETSIARVQWLVGTWVNETDEGNMYESWSKVSEKELTGRSYMVQQDTVYFETIRLVEEQGQLYYIPTVKDQNQGLPVRFTATKVSASQLLFENPQHDFPQLISYTLISKDSVVAEISGKNEKGELQKQIYPMKKVVD